MSIEEKLPKGWVWARLEDAIEIRDDLRVPINSDERGHRSGPYPYYGATGQVGWIDDYLMDGEYVLLGEDGAPFLDPLKPKAYIISGRCWVNNHAHVLHFLESLGSNRYLMHMLNTLDYHNVVSGTTRLKLTQSAMRQLLISLAPLPEQHRIVAVIEQQFTRLDSAVASLKSAKNRAKQCRASLLKSAVEGELTKAWRAEHPPEETGAQLLKRILAERRTRWEEEQLAKMCEKGHLPLDDSWKKKYKEPKGPDDEKKLPEGWCWATVEQISLLVTDGDHNPPKRVSSGMPHLTARNIVNSQIDFTACSFITKEDAERVFSRYKPLAGDLLITCVGTLGRTAIVPENVVFSPDRNLAAIRTVYGAYFTKYLEYILLSPDFQTKLAQASGSTAQPHLYLTDLRALELPLPSLSELVQIVAEIEAHLTELTKTEETIEHCLKRTEHERQSILREAFAGHLVPQDPNDEPASVLLERIGEERKKQEEAEKVVRRSRKGGSMSKKHQKSKVIHELGGVGLYETLVKAGQPLAPEELFKQAGLKADDQPESVEMFYRELSSDAEAGYIAEARPAPDSIFLEALEPAEDDLVNSEEAELDSYDEQQLEVHDEQKSEVEEKRKPEASQQQTLRGFE